MSASVAHLFPAPSNRTVDTEYGPQTIGHLTDRRPMSQSILHGWEEVAVSARPALEVVERRLPRRLVPARPPCGEALPLFLLQGRVDFEHRDWCTTAGAVSVHTHHYAGAVGLTPGLDVCRIL